MGRMTAAPDRVRPAGREASRKPAAQEIQGPPPGAAAEPASRAAARGERHRSAAEPAGQIPAAAGWARAKERMARDEVLRPPQVSRPGAARMVQRPVPLQARAASASAQASPGSPLRVHHGPGGRPRLTRRSCRPAPVRGRRSHNTGAASAPHLHQSNWSEFSFPSLQAPGAGPGFHELLLRALSPAR
jgi:hypothetical protein